jgi:hypothetical protein
MATPRKGAIIKPFSSGDLARITGSSGAGLPNTGAQTVATRAGAQGKDAAPDAAMRAAFEPGVQFFPSGRPLRPVAPEGTTTARAWDFPSFLNLNYLPRTEQGEGAIGFETLRRLASPEHGGLDLLRLVIETRKDQMSAQRWSIRAKGDKNNTGGTKGGQFRDWMKKPDGVNTFRGWLRMILEDHFVLDAVAIYFRETKMGGKTRPLFELMDGSTIKRYITADGGRTPQPPLPAYAQVIKGMPAEDYTLDELAYHVYNPMTNRLYGTSRVAQVLVTVNTALNRAMYTLEYFTSGTTPDGFMELPKEWSLQRVQQWTEWFNSELEGLASERRKIRFVPQGANYKGTKDEILKDVFDEWLARIICYCFSLPPQAFVKEVNRATAETAKEAAQEEGLEPTKLWVKDVIDDMLVRCDAEDLELYWEDEEIVDPEAKSKVIQTYTGGPAGTAQKIMTLDEARDMAGLPPATPKQKLELSPPAPEPPDPGAGGGGDGGEPGDDAANGKNGANGNGKKKPAAAAADKNGKEKAKESAAEKLAKALRARGIGGGRSLPPLELSETKLAESERALHGVVGKVLGGQHRAARIILLRQATKLAKAEADDVVDEATLRDLIRAVEADPWNEANREALRAALRDLADYASREATRKVMEAVGADDAATIASLTQASEAAIAWADARVGNLITQTSETTQNLVNQLASNAIESGLTNAELATRLDGAFLFGEDRSLLIAQTELQFAANHGALAGYKASGVVDGKEWFGEDPCDDCEANIEDGVIGLDEDFSSGDPAPPAHPRCKCSIAPAVRLLSEV